MNTYLKYKPVWYRIVVLGSLIIGSSMVIGLVTLYIISHLTGIPLKEIQVMDFNNPELLNAQKFLIAANGIAVFLLPALLYSYFTDPRPMHFLRLNTRAQHWHWVVAVAIVIIAIPSAFWLGELNKNMDLSRIMPGVDKWMRESEASNNKIVETLLVKQSLKDLFINLFILAALPAISEEVFFRGLIQKGIIRTSRNVWLGILLSALIFSAFHLQFLTFLTRFEMGIILGVLFWYSGSLWVPIVAHFAFNGIQVFMAYWRPDLKDAPPEATSAGLVGLSFLLVILIVVILRKTSVVSMYEVYDDEDDFDLHAGPKDEYLL